MQPPAVPSNSAPYAPPCCPPFLITEITFQCLSYPGKVDISRIFLHKHLKLLLEEFKREIEIFADTNPPLGSYIMERSSVDSKGKIDENWRVEITFLISKN